MQIMIATHVFIQFAQDFGSQLLRIYGLDGEYIKSKSSLTHAISALIIT